MTIEINGESYIEVSELDKVIAESISENTENITIDVGTLTEKYQRLSDDLESKRAEREQKQTDAELRKLIDDKYSSSIKDVESFYSLAKSRGAASDEDVHQLYKLLPKQAKKSAISRLFS